MSLNDLLNKNVLIDPANKHFFSGELYNLLVDRQDEYFDIVNDFIKRQSSTAAFGSEINKEIKSWMSDILNDFLVTAPRSDFVGYDILLPKRSLDVTIQGFFNVHQDENKMFNLWELERLFNKNSFNPFTSDRFYIHNITDFKDDKSFFRKSKYTGVRVFYSKLPASNLSNLFGEFSENKVLDNEVISVFPKTEYVGNGDVFFDKKELEEESVKKSASNGDSLKSDVKPVVNPSFNYVRIRSDFEKNYDELYRDKNKIDDVKRSAFNKALEEIYEHHDLLDYKTGTVIPEDKMLMFLDIHFGREIDSFVPFLTSKFGKEFVNYFGAPTDDFLRHVYENREDIILSIKRHDPSYAS